MEAIDTQTSTEREQRSTNLLAGFATLLAALSATCCVLPIALTVIGLGGAWLSVLGPFVAYREIILATLSVLVGLAIIRELRRRSEPPRRRTIFLLILATTVLAAAWSAPLWENDLSCVLLSIWSEAK